MNAIGSFVCVNNTCKEYNNSFNTLELMSNPNNVRHDYINTNTSNNDNNNNNNNNKMVFICDMCGDELMDESERFLDESISNLDIKRAFNQQIIPLERLLDEVETAVQQERIKMMTNRKTAIEKKEAIEQGFDEVTYKASNLNFGKMKTEQPNAQEESIMMELYVKNIHVCPFISV